MVNFYEIARTRNVLFYNRKCVRIVPKVTSADRRVADVDGVVGLCSDHSRISFPLIRTVHGFGVAELVRFQILDLYGWCVLRGERNEFLKPLLLCLHSRIHFEWSEQPLVKFTFCKCTKWWQGRLFVRCGNIHQYYRFSVAAFIEILFLWLSFLALFPLRFALHGMFVICEFRDRPNMFNLILCLLI